MIFQAFRQTGKG